MRRSARLRGTKRYLPARTFPSGQS
jgi:hypothetical protein